jgi:hypothetical protein
VPIKNLLGLEAIDCLAHNILLVYTCFDETSFREIAWNGLEPLGIMERAQHLAKALRQHLPENYSAAIEIIENLLQLRFGEIDQDLQSIIPQWMNLNSAEHAHLILQLAQLSKAELIQSFQS